MSGGIVYSYLTFNSSQPPGNNAEGTQEQKILISEDLSRKDWEKEENFSHQVALFCFILKHFINSPLYCVSRFILWTDLLTFIPSYLIQILNRHQINKNSHNHVCRIHWMFIDDQQWDNSVDSLSRVNKNIYQQAGSPYTVKHEHCWRMLEAKNKKKLKLNFKAFCK